MSPCDMCHGEDPPPVRSPRADCRPGENDMHGLRERKKADTHDAIRVAAADLFLRDGFERTTMEAVADAANVSVRTVFRYFPTKEDLVFGDAEADLADFRELLDTRPADEPVMASVRAVVEILAGRI